MKTFIMNTRGNILSSRITGKKIFEQSEQEGFNVVFDFTGVELVNSSFADELFGKMIEQDIRTFKVINIESPLIKRMILMTMEGRRVKEKEFA